LETKAQATLIKSCPIKSFSMKKKEAISMHQKSAKGEDDNEQEFLKVVGESMLPKNWIISS
jgi:hypothetical protein